MQNEHTITICLGSSCFARGNKEILNIVKRFLSVHELEELVFFRGELCSGNCENGPILKIDNAMYSQVNSNNVFQILNEYFNVNH
ncbi:Thioredoxin-like [2Fe-2S] ferredoxin [Saccharicrinis carchari]|uniref:Thioredoxin-like [2Fe-2S] ferredoxin n=1 Tax=Saccharicrinis carchari TaxID=1168039 RepID=A0A521DSM1_SACCC|nr:(2Fe-2S) ferredoxin domain-containing protein [Saccharicrinis carchari]SMO74753.1 Thioredoxin-like [2Fe-2S] ferredoxin [Saccharicrinis carchari]